ncbi:TPA: lysogenic protein [Serratia marcescens]|uniref:lysogenic protein n=1 Tax=Serratia marcescens TaxID=615 RepID=UPI0018D842FE|nr:lysogenic protein [Serratia marcescens]
MVSIATSIIALFSGFLAVWAQFRISKSNRDFERLKLLEMKRLDSEFRSSVYKEPLLNAAFDLQSRLYNILNMKFIEVYYLLGSERQRHYVINNTVFLFSQYLAWTEAVRVDIQCIDLGNSEMTRRLSLMQRNISSTLQSDRYNPILMVFAGEQRAIGERMLKSIDGKLSCIGFGEYLSSEFNLHDPLMEMLTDEVKKVASNVLEASGRLSALQHGLIDMLDFLDPDFIRFPKERRGKV